jgi:hypothetical protein
MAGTCVYPFNFVSRRGIPLIESNSAISNGTNVVIAINNGAFRYLNGKGIILFRLNTPIPEDAASLPIVLSSNGITQPLTLVGGEGATAAQLTGIGVYQIYYDKVANVLQLMTYGVEPTTATNSNNGTNGTNSTNGTNKSKY